MRQRYKVRTLALILFCLPFGADDAPERGTPFELIFSGASQNVDEARHSFRADECAGALDQHNQSEEKEKGDPDPDRGLNHRQTTNKRGIDARPTLNAASVMLTTALPRSISLRRALLPIMMGREPNALRACLEATTGSRSLEVIYRSASVGA